MASKALRPNLVYDTTTVPFSSYHKLINKLPSLAEIKNRNNSSLFHIREKNIPKNPLRNPHKKRPLLQWMIQNFLKTPVGSFSVFEK